jgi:hypothetical protein
MVYSPGSKAKVSRQQIYVVWLLGSGHSKSNITRIRDVAATIVEIANSAVIYEPPPDNFLISR